MVVNNLDIFGARVRPPEAHTELIVDADAALAGAVTLQRFETIARRHPEIVEPRRDLQLSQLTPRNVRDIPEPFDPLTRREGLRVGALEALDQVVRIVTRRMINVKRD